MRHLDPSLVFITLRVCRFRCNLPGPGGLLLSTGSMALFTSHAGTLLGPLTTAWSMPDSCTNFVVNCAECTFGFRGQQCVAGTSSTNAEDHTTCWPPAISRAGTPRHPFIGWGFYSPGLACPTGYTTACTAQHGGRAEWDIQFTLVPGETAVGCCPEYVADCQRLFVSCQTGVLTSFAQRVPVYEPQRQHVHRHNFH